ncbi:hypothetical protein QRB41_24380 [Mycobacterium avium subsp. hominissuis]|uniref:DUF4226 domain-containing protein n=1 Tax=Mycobacterium avium TaxID=1764 RepID=A0A2A2ZBC4_MYCAV|nr:hypothetical protein [Mycobacterium avium]MBZ4571558.1 hypothetical protein [Mycobacterium avium subsp. hominissuis]MDO2386480.1 hypothetical protein [Mycobacterium avium subsp. hominissuis]PBA23708.1 hypothetical protein CKJ66_26865 [Mycobacterium avium]
MDPVDALLQQARQLLGTSSPPDPEPAGLGEPNLAGQHPASWDGDASTQAATTSATLDGQRDQLRTTHHNATTTIAAANTIGQNARDNLTAVQTAWQQDKSTFTPTTAQGQAALLQAGQQRITEATQIVEDTASQYQSAAQRLQTHTTELSNDSTDPTIQAVDFTDLPQRPQTDDPRQFWLGTDDIVTLEPGALGPNGYMELAPNSGVWVPNPRKFPVGVDRTPSKSPIDLSRVVHLTPGQLGPYGYDELVPGSGTWIPSPNSLVVTPDPGPPQSPIDLRKIVQVPAGQLGPSGYTELVPGTWVPDPRANGPR